MQYNELFEVDFKENLVGKIIKIKVTKAQTWSLFGEIIQEEI